MPVRGHRCRRAEDNWALLCVTVLQVFGRCLVDPASMQRRPSHTRRPPGYGFCYDLHLQLSKHVRCPPTTHAALKYPCDKSVMHLLPHLWAYCMGAP
eukprot:444254-Pelagomonas_calceolata.AAC.2